MSEELRPCPFCGEEPFVIHFPAPHDDVVQCIPCSRKSANMSPEDWNTRPIEDALRADLARKDAVIAALDELVEALQIYPLHFQSSIDTRESARARLAEVRGEGQQ